MKKLIVAAALCAAMARAEEPAETKITFLGDVMCHDSMMTAYKTTEGKFDFSEVFADIKDFLAQSDLVCANLETPISPDNTNLTNERWCFNSPHEFAEAVKAAGIDVVFTANNHCLDRGLAGISATLGVLADCGFHYTGTFADTTAAESPLYVTVNGFKIGLLSYTYGSNAWSNKQYLDDNDLWHVNFFQRQEVNEPSAQAWMTNPNSADGRAYAAMEATRHPENLTLPWYERTEDHVRERARLANDVARMREGSPDLVVMSMHAGGQYNPEATSATRELAGFLQDAGVDIIAGSHEHVVHGSDFTRIAENKLVTYSLGDFDCLHGTWLDVEQNVSKLHPDYSIAWHVYLTRDADGKAKVSRTDFDVLKVVKGDTDGHIRVLLAKDVSGAEQDLAAVSNRFVNSVRVQNAPKAKSDAAPSEGAQEVCYEVLDYIGTDTAKDQYIDTRYVPNAKTTITAEFQSKDTATQGYVFGTFSETGGRCQFLYRSNPFIGFGAGSTSASAGAVTVDQEWHTVGLTNGTFRLDGKDYWNGASYAWSGSAQSLHLFACNRKGAHQDTDACSLRLRSLVISEDGVVKHDFAPARSLVSRPGAVGLYDRVTGAFIQHEGRGELEAGEVVDYVYARTTELEVLTEDALETALNQSYDVIILPEGTLTLTKCCTLDKLVTLRGSGDRETIVKTTSATDCAFSLDSWVATLENMTIDGVTITGNRAEWKYKAAGVEMKSGTLRDVTVRNCKPSDNGNVSAVLFTDIGDSCLMENCTVTNNDCGAGSKYALGTVCCRNPKAIIRNCEIAWNKSQGAAGLYLFQGSAEYCDIHHNEARASYDTDGNVGGLRLDSGSAKCCAITNNMAGRNAGGVWLRGGTLVNCLVAKNTAAGNGGGMSVYNGTATYCNIGGNTAAGSGAGVYVETGSDGDTPDLQFNLIDQNGDHVQNEVVIAKGKPSFKTSAMREAVFEVCKEAKSDLWCRILTKNPFRADGSYLTVDSADYEGIDDANGGQSTDEIHYPTVDFLGRSRPLPGFRISGSTVKSVARDIGCCEWDAHFDGKIYVSTTGSSVSPYITPETAATNLNDALSLQATFPNLRIAVCPGTYDTKGMTEIPAGVVVFGNGPRGEVVFTSSETIAADKAILVVNGGTVSNLVVRGGVSVGSNVGTVPAASGVWVKKGLITNCEITGCKVLEANYDTSGNCAQALVLGVMGGTADSAIACGCKVSNNDGCFGTTSGKGGTSPRASAVYVANGGRLERCEVANNRGSPGGVTMVNVNELGYSSLVDGCDIHDNFSYLLPGGILLGTYSRVWNTRIASNRVERNVNSLGGGVRSISTTCELVNCLIEGNEADVGGGLHTVCPGNRVIHCTIVGNKAGTAGGLYVGGGAMTHGLLQNTIVADNVSESGDQVVRDSGFLDVKNSLLANMPTGLIDGGGNLEGVSPKFVNPAAHDWHLRKKSPCIDAGSDDYPTPYATGKDYAADFDGTVRPQDGKCSGTPIPDMGCYEYVYTSKGMIIFVR